MPHIVLGSINQVLPLLQILGLQKREQVMTISFGLAASQQKRTAAPVAPVSQTSLFFEREKPAESTVKRAKVKEMSHGCLKFAENTTESLSYGPHRNQDGQAVIPCTNKLDTSTKETVKAPQPVKPKEIKYGLNVLSKVPLCRSSTKQEDIASDTEGVVNSGGSENDKTGNNSSNATEQTSTFDGKNHKKDDNPLDAGKSKNLKQDSEAPATTTDADVAKMILEDLEKQRLREQLFGVDLVERAANTVPILLRKSNSAQVRNQGDIMEHTADKTPSYDHVSVDEFGLAMLLGMGFDPKTNNNKPKEYKRRVYERAGLGADAQMKQNMETLTDAGAMAKLKKDQMYNQAHSIQDPAGAFTTWLLPGLYVRVVERGSSHFGEKGLVKRVEPTGVTVEIGGAEVTLSHKALETVISLDTAKCKVVRRIARHAEKFYVPVGTVVEVSKVTKTYAKITFRDQSITVSLDDICEFR